MRLSRNANTAPGAESRGGRNHFNPAAPVRDLRECATILNITYEQAKAAQRSALDKLREALQAFQYEGERA